MILRYFQICRRAVTLTELLVASILVGIVTVGVISFYLMYEQTVHVGADQANVQPMGAVLIGELKKDAMKAVGDPFNPGIVTVDTIVMGPPDSGTRGLCFRHDVSNPASYADDRWVCYRHGNSWHVYRCVGNSGLAPCVACNCAGYVRSNYTAALAVSRGTTGDPAPPFYEIINDANGRFKSIRFNIWAMHDSRNRQPYHPVTNPRYKLTTEVSPPGISR